MSAQPWTNKRWALDQVLVHPNPMPSCDYLPGAQVNGCQ